MGQSNNTTTTNLNNPGPGSAAYQSSGTGVINNGAAGNGNALNALLSAGGVSTPSNGGGSGSGSGRSSNGNGGSNSNSNGGGSWLTRPLTPAEIIIFYVALFALMGLIWFFFS